MNPADEKSDLIRNFGPVLEAMYRQLGSWEAVGAKIGHDLKHCNDELNRIKLTARSKK